MFHRFDEGRFRDRVEAGRLLGEALGGVRDEDPVVLGLPRGGVQVAAEVARALEAELGVILIRKLGAPGQPELAIGAVADNGAVVLNEDILYELGVPDAYLEEVIRREREALAERVRAYGTSRPHGELAGRTVILVDDGAATGATMRAAVQAVREDGPRRVVAALPVAAAETVRRLEEVADEVVCLRAPVHLMAVGVWYHDFRQVADEEVRGLLEEARRRRAAGAGGSDGAEGDDGPGGET